MVNNYLLITFHAKSVKRTKADAMHRTNRISSVQMVNARIKFPKGAKVNERNNLEMDYCL